MNNTNSPARSYETQFAVPAIAELPQVCAFFAVVAIFVYAWANLDPYDVGISPNQVEITGSISQPGCKVQETAFQSP